MLNLHDGEGFSDISLRPGMDCLLSMFLAPFCVDHDHGNLENEVQAAQWTKELEPTRRGHIDIRENQVNLLRLRQIETFVPGYSL